MQSSSGEHHHQQQPPQTPYFLGAPCDPNLLAFAQHTLLSYPAHKSMYHQVYPSSQVPQMVVPHRVMPPMPNRSLLPSLTAAIPDMDKLLMEEPIEAGNLPYRRGNADKVSLANKSTSADDSFNTLHRSSSSSHFRRHSAHWETMTDDEREMIQREKRKEEAFKTALCDAYKRAGNCPYGDSCRFAHGENELRMPSQPRGKAHPKYKTQLCDKFSTFGQCPYGPRCQFIHKLKKGLPLLEYNRALYQGQISPARDDEITNPDESGDQSALSLTRTVLRRRSSTNAGILDTSDSGYSGSNHQNHHRHSLEDQPRGGKVVYPPMQVVNIEMATRRSSSDRRHHHHQNQNQMMINQADYEAAMASGKMFGKPENIRTYGAMIRANEEHVERNQTGTKRDRVKTQKKDLSLIREENTLLVEDSQLHTSAVAPPVPTSSGPNAPPSEGSTTTMSKDGHAWYEKIFGKKMTIIKEESMGEEDSEDDADGVTASLLKNE